MTKRYWVGTAIKFTSIISPTIPTSVTITVKDPGGTAMVTGATMTQENTGVYTYIYQSKDTDIYGKYTAVVSAVYNGYTTVSILEVELEEQPGLLR